MAVDESVSTLRDVSSIEAAQELICGLSDIRFSWCTNERRYLKVARRVNRTR
jgi:hypothetical protein